MASLTLKGISKRFGKLPVLSRIDLHVEDGCFCVLLGPSGCGKSTLLNIIAGLVPCDEGTVLLDGEAVDDLPPRDRDMAMVFQSYALYPHMTVAGNLGFGLRMRNVNRDVIGTRVSETAALLGIGDLLHRKPRELSGGQRQRVAMGRALVRRPRLFLLDEPLSNLDARLRAAVRVELKQLHTQLRSTIVYVTHDQVEAMTLGDTVVVMREGTIRQSGSPESVYGKPADTFVARFIGSPEMNLYRGTLEVRGGTPRFRGAGFAVPVGGAHLDHTGGEVQLGIRPEDIEIRRRGPGTLRATVELVSDVGSEKYLHVRLGEETLTLRAAKDVSAAPGETIPLAVDPAKLHLFRDGIRIRFAP